MPDPEIATQTAQAANQAAAGAVESAPTEKTAVGAESAPAAEKQSGETKPPEAAGSEPAKESPEAVEELKKVRKRAQEAEAREAQKAAEAEYYRLQAAELSKPKQKVFEKEPAFEDYADPEEFKKDFEEFHSARISEKIRRESVVKTYVQKCEEVKKNLPDFDEAVNKLEVRFSQPFNDAIIESDMGPQIVYYLGKNPTEAMRLYNMTIGSALIELGEIRAKLKNAPEPPKPKIESQAPKPTRSPEPGITEMPEGADDTRAFIERRRREKLGLKA